MPREVPDKICSTSCHAHGFCSRPFSCARSHRFMSVHSMHYMWARLFATGCCEQKLKLLAWPWHPRHGCLRRLIPARGHTDTLPPGRTDCVPAHRQVSRLRAPRLPKSTMFGPRHGHPSIFVGLVAEPGLLTQEAETSKYRAFMSVPHI